MVAVDPDSGRFVLPDDAARAAMGDEFEARSGYSSEGLVEVESSVPGGGTTLHLQGRFRGAMTVSRNDAGELVQACALPNCLH